jgi:hypothetical protein
VPLVHALPVAPYNKDRVSNKNFLQPYRMVQKKIYFFQRFSKVAKKVFKKKFSAA